LSNVQLGASMEAVRKLLAIALLAVFGLPLVPPLLALGPTSDAGLPACCRRNGKHHCAKSAEESVKPPQGSQLFSATPEKCPSCPTSVAIIHGDAFAPPAAQAVYAGLIAHPAIVAQTESKLRISRGRSRQKRGPPISFSL
jgi:hypothetical protein